MSDSADAMTFPRPLTDRESEVLQFLLSVDVPAMRRLREQARTAQVGEKWPDGCPSIDLVVDRSAAPRAAFGLSPIDRLTVKTKAIEHDNPTGAQLPPLDLWLFINDGWLKSIELVHPADEGTPPVFPPPDAFEAPAFEGTQAEREAE